MNKAVRQVSAALIPELNRDIVLNDDGTLSDEVVDYFEGLCEDALNNMSKNKEISAKEAKIDPTQNILSTSTLEVTLVIVPTGTAEQIVINVGFATSL